MPRYDRAIIFTKKGNLHDYLYTDKVCYGGLSGKPFEQAKAYYESEREIQLIALIRWETDGPKKSKLLCRIKCPINPLPVKGEFELPSSGSLRRFLKANGWAYKQTVFPGMFEGMFE